MMESDKKRACSLQNSGQEKYSLREGAINTLRDISLKSNTVETCLLSKIKRNKKFRWGGGLLKPPLLGDRVNNYLNYLAR